MAKVTEVPVKPNILIELDAVEARELYEITSAASRLYGLYELLAKVVG